MNTINLQEKFGQFSEYWTPKIVAELNDSYVKIAKVKGEMVWHCHEHEDELFLVLKGRLNLKMRQGEVHLGPGEIFVVPKGVEHLPCAEEETHILLLEPKSTAHTGTTPSDITVAVEEQQWI